METRTVEEGWKKFQPQGGLPSCPRPRGTGSPGLPRAPDGIAARRRWHCDRYSETGWKRASGSCHLQWCAHLAPWAPKSASPGWWLTLGGFLILISFSVNMGRLIIINVDQCKEKEENNRMGKNRDLFKKIRDTKVTYRSHSRGPLRFPAPLHLSPFSPSDRDRCIAAAVGLGSLQKRTWNRQ